MNEILHTNLLLVCETVNDTFWSLKLKCNHFFNLTFLFRVFLKNNLYPVYEGLYSFSPEGGRQHFPEEHVNIQMQVKLSISFKHSKIL